MLKTGFSIVIIVVLTACSKLPEQSLTKVLQTNQKGVTQTITNKERLKEFEKYDLLSHQPCKKLIRFFKSDNCVKSIVTTYYPNGRIYQLLECKDNHAFGAYNEWFSNGVQKVKANVIMGIPDIDTSSQNSWVFDGENQIFDEEGRLIATFPYKNGHLEGDNIIYYPSQKIKQKSPYIMNQLQGICEIFDEEGNYLEKTRYKDNLKDGSSLKYWKKNRLAHEEKYEQGSLITGVYFDRLGNLIGQVKDGKGKKAFFNEDYSFELREFRNGAEEGEVTVFDPKGKLKNSYHLKNGVKDGVEKVFDPVTQNETLELDWIAGKIHGVVKTWYPNGKLESQNEMSLNRKQGISTAWYMDGNLMLIEEYDSGRLVKGKYFEKGNTTPISTISQGQGVATLFDKLGIFIRKIEYSGGKPIE